MKYCKSCEFKYPDSVINCRACGRALIDIPADQNSQTQGTSSVSSSQCTNPECEIIFPRTDQTKFCPGCGTQLEPISPHLGPYRTTSGILETSTLSAADDAERIPKQKRPRRSRK